MGHVSLGRLLAAAALVAAAVGIGVPAPASAAGCTSGAGVTVVVDFKELGGGVRSVCDPGGGGQKASALFPDNGYPLSYASRQPGFVCRVSGVPTSDPCVNTSPASAYWGLWWSDGKSGSWSYSSLGAGSLTIPEGGYVAFSWDQSDGDAKPGFTPAARSSAPPSPTVAPSPSTTPGPGSGSGAGSGPAGGQTGGPQGSTGQTPTSAPSVSVTPTAAAASSPTASGAPTAPTGAKAGGPGGAGSSTPAGSPTAGATGTASASPSPEADLEPIGGGVSPTAADPADAGLPSYVAPLLIVVLFGVAGGAFMARRRRGTP